MRGDFSSLRDSRFRRLFFARALSLAGSYMAPLALTFAVLDLPGNSATNLGLVLGSRTVAALIFVLVGGVLADRFERGRLMVGSDFLTFIAQATAAWLILAGEPKLVALIAVSAVAGGAEAVFTPAIRGIIPQVVPDDHRQGANGLLRLIGSADSVLGALLAGVIIAIWNPGTALAVAAAAFLCSSLLLVNLRVPTSEHVTEENLLKDLASGWREFRSRSWVWIVVLQFSVINLCFAPSVFVLGPILAEEYMGGAAPWSFVLAANAAGLVFGALLAIRVRPDYPMRVAVMCTFGFLPPLVLLALQAPVWALILCLFVNGLSANLFEVLWETSLQDHVPPDSLSRVSSYDILGSFALGPVGMALVGPLSAAIGVAQTLTFACLAMFLSNAAALAAPSVRRLPRAAPRSADIGAAGEGS